MAVKAIPNPETARETLKEAQGEQVFWEKLYPELLERYPDQFVAVQHGEVIANNPDLTRLVVLLEAKHIDPTKVWVRFISSKSNRLLL